MLDGQPSTETVMLRLKEFVGDRPIVAHNATFDSKFFFAELQRASSASGNGRTAGQDHKRAANEFLCTLKLARRVLVGLRSHKLSALKHVIAFRATDYREVVETHFKSFQEHKDHRALDDVLVTVSLWLHLTKRLDILYSSPKVRVLVDQKVGKKKLFATTLSGKVSFYLHISKCPVQDVHKFLSI